MRDYPLLEAFQRVRMAKLYAKALAEDNIDRPTTELHEANNALVSQLLLETLMSDDTEPGEKTKAAAAIAQLQSAQIRNEKLKIDARKANSNVRAAFALFREQVWAEIDKHPDIVAKILEIADSIAEKESQ